MLLNSANNISNSVMCVCVFSARTCTVICTLGEEAKTNGNLWCNGQSSHTGTETKELMMMKMMMMMKQQLRDRHCKVLAVIYRKLL